MREMDGQIEAIANVVVSRVEERLGCYKRPSERMVETFVKYEVFKDYCSRDDYQEIMDASIRTAFARISHRIDFRA